MNPPDDAFDQAARRAYAASLDALSPRVRAQLAVRRATALGAATPRRTARWGWAGAAATACVLVVAVQFGPWPRMPPRIAIDAPATPAVPADPGAVLAEDPDFYLWLASSESKPYTPE